MLVVGASWYLNAPDYRVLFADMEPEEASRVESGLKSEKVQYQLTNGGRDIEVPKEEVDRLRLHFSSTGLPTSGRVGYELFDRTAFGQTEFLEQVNYRRALEGEIARTIATIGDVRSARVHIAMAKTSLFESKEQPAKASVILTLKRNRPLAASTVAGIVNLVSFSVEGLRPEAVVLIDSTGRPLARPSGDSDEPLSAAVMERQEKMERELAGEVVRMIEPIVGSERVRANVTLRLNTKTQEETSETFDPATVIRSRQVTLEGAAANAASGLAGARGNLPGQAQPAPAATPVTPPAAADRVAHRRRHRPPGRDRQLRSRQEDHAQPGAARRRRAPVGGGRRRQHPAIEDRRRRQGDAHVDAAPGGRDAEDPAARRRRRRPRHRPRRPADRRERVVRRADRRAGRGADAPAARRRRGPELGPAGHRAGRRPGGAAVRPAADRQAASSPTRRRLRRRPRPAPRRSRCRGQLPRTIEEVENEIEAELDAKVADHLSHRKTPILQKRVAKAIETEPENAARLIRAWLSQEEA